ncbi:MAG: hypothetical protein ACT4QA_02120 [Panacagrimonas sp.]
MILRRLALTAPLVLLSGVARTTDELQAVARPCLEVLDQAGDAVITTELPACAPMLDAYRAYPSRVPGAVPRTADALRDWLALVADETVQAPSDRRQPVALADLDPILAGIQQDRQQAPESLWARFKRWLLAQLPASRDRSNEVPAWLRWLELISPDAIRRTGWIAFALMALTLLWIVARELHVLGAFSRRPRTPPGRLPPPALVLEPQAPPSLTEVADLPAGEQPVALFRFVLASLRATRQLPVDDSLTHRELQRCLQGDEDEQRLFGLIAGVAESRIYGGFVPGAEQVRDLIEAAARFERPLAK